MTFTMSLNILGKQCVFSRSPWTSMQSNLRTTRSPPHLSISVSIFRLFPTCHSFSAEYIYRYERGDGPRIQRDRKQTVKDALDAWEHTNCFPWFPFLNPYYLELLVFYYYFNENLLLLLLFLIVITYNKRKNI